MLTFDEMMVPVWDTETVYGESLLMVKDKDGEASAPLLYEPTAIREVTNASYTETYEEGRDWELINGRLRVLPGSRIPVMTPEDFFFAQEKPGECFAAPGGFSLFKEGSFFHERQICVTYDCRRGGWTGPVPVYAKALLPRTLHALQHRKGLNMLLYGDSISWGCNASRLSNTPPYQPCYGELLAEQLTRVYGTPVHFTNAAIGGQDSAWGVRWAERLVADYRPDLVLLAFGMNDGGKTVREFEENCRKIIDIIRAAKPETEFILIATTTPNPLLTDEKAPFWGNQIHFKEALDRIASDTLYGGGMAVADITGMQQELHAHKRFADTTGNNVNHPNDFFHRLYAQYLSGMLLRP